MTSCRGFPVSPETTSQMWSFSSTKRSRTFRRLLPRSAKPSAAQRAWASRARATAAVTASRSATGYSARRAPVAGLVTGIVRRTGTSLMDAPWAMGGPPRTEIRGTQAARSTRLRVTVEGQRFSFRDRHLLQSYDHLSSDVGRPGDARVGEECREHLLR